MKKVIIPIPGQEPAKHLSRIVRFGNLLFVSGTTGRDPKTKQLAGEDMQSQTRQALENIKVALGAAGASLADVVKVTCYVSDLAEKKALDEVYVSYFPQEPPARACVQVAALGAGVKVEMEAIVGVPS
jgi:2-iminobutanoate/2-iminopropanoate deaminase